MQLRPTTPHSAFMVIGVALAGVAISAGPSAVADPQSATGPSAWRVLFDGTSLDAWRGYKGGPIPEGWRIENGALVKEKPVADIVSKDEFGDFELEIEWKIGRAGNSGIFYRGTEEYDHVYLERSGISIAR